MRHPSNESESADSGSSAIELPTVGERPASRRLSAVAGAALALGGLVAGGVAGAALERDRRPAAVASDQRVGDSDDATDVGAGSSSAALGSAGGAMASPGFGGGAITGDYESGHGMALEWVGSAQVGGLTVRLLDADHGPWDDGNPLWDPAPGCFVTGAWSAQVSGDRFVSLLNVDRFERPGVPDGTVQLVGVPEGSPYWVVVADIDDDVTVTFPDGQQAQAAAIAGVAVAAAPASDWTAAEQDDHGWTASIDGTDGRHEIHSWWYPDEDFHRDNCEPPPPTLPAPGEQPGDPGAATDEIVAALQTVFGGGRDADRSPFVEHPEIAARAFEQVAENYPDIVSSATFHDLVFTAPDTAYFRWDLVTDITTFDDQIGEARRIDGRWVLTTETVCTQLRRGGATCTPPER